MDSTVEFLRFLFHRYMNSGCKKCLDFYIRTPVILPLSPEVSGCGKDHPPFLFGATWPHIFATTLEKNKNQAVADPALNTFFKWSTKVPNPDPNLDVFFDMATRPTSPVDGFKVSFLSLFTSFDYYFQYYQNSTPMVY